VLPHCLLCYFLRPLHLRCHLPSHYHSRYYLFCHEHWPCWPRTRVCHPPANHSLKGYCSHSLLLCCAPNSQRQGRRECMPPIDLCSVKMARRLIVPQVAVRRRVRMRRDRRDTVAVEFQLNRLRLHRVSWGHRDIPSCCFYLLSRMVIGLYAIKR